MALIATIPAKKFGLASTVSLFRVAALRTGNASSSWVNDSHRNANQLGLIFDKLTELTEGPAGVLIALLSPNRDPLAYACKIFNGNAARSVFGNLDNLLRNAVVFMLAETRFFPREPAKLLLASFTPHFLKSLAKSMVFLSNTER